MNLKHLGDALDGWKNWALGILVPDACRLTIIPMFTDAGGWTTEHLDLYKRMIGAGSDVVLKDKVFSDTNRRTYFDEAVKAVSDRDYIFVDPDNGPWTSNAKKNPDKYVTADELVGLMPDSEESDTMVIVYRHESRSQNIQGLQGYTSRLLADHQVHAFGVLCGVTSLLCISRKQDGKLADSRCKIVDALNPIADCRVTKVVPVE